MSHTHMRKGMGAEISVKDNRDISYADVLMTKVRAAVLPSMKITDVSMLEHEDQMQLGTCCSQAEGKGAEYDEYKETGKVVRMSKRFGYIWMMVFDGQLNSGVQGSSGRTAAKVRTNVGYVPVEDCPDDNALQYSQYLNFNIGDPTLLAKAAQYKAASFAFCYTLDDVKNAIVNEGYMNASVMVGNWESGDPLHATPAEGLHRAFIYGYEDAVNPATGKVDTKIYDFNSWGKDWNDQGNGWWWWSEYEHNTYDMIVYTDMPDVLLKQAQTTTYQFTRELQYGMKGDDVMQLQRRLNTEIALDGLPCYNYKENGAIYFSTYFGPATQGAVQRYQTMKGIVKGGTPATTGYGRMGKTTMGVLNAGTVVQESMIEKWADAIQNREGWAVGSRSYRNNNPGNLRYVGQSRAIGQDSGRFCIFKTYDDGRQTLIDMLTLDCTGKSTIYSPEMTLLAYYRKYAPVTDGNDPDGYAAFVAAELGVTITTQIKNFA